MRSDAVGGKVPKTAHRLVRAGRIVAWAAVLGAAGFLAGSEPADEESLPGVVTRRDLVYSKVGGTARTLDLHRPAGGPPAGGWPAVVAIHGGGWRGGSKEEFGRMAARLAQHGVVVASVDYTLSRPGKPSWPANRDDVRAAVRWLRRDARALGIDPRRIAAMGASAGGHLAELLGTDPGIEASRVSAVVSFYGASDLASLSKPCLGPGGPVDLLLGGPPNRRPGAARAASPIAHASADDAPMLLIHGLDDPLIPPDQSRRLAGAMAGVGVSCRVVEIPGAAHGFGFRLGERDLLPEVLAFLEGRWKDTLESGPSAESGGTGNHRFAPGTE